VTAPDLHALSSSRPEILVSSNLVYSISANSDSDSDSGSDSGASTADGTDKCQVITDTVFLTGTAHSATETLPIDEVGDLALLNALIEENEELRSQEKYRIGSQPIQNYDKIQARKALKVIISEKQAKRVGLSGEADKVEEPIHAAGALWNGKPLVGNSKKKKFKKPPNASNVGGGVLGTSYHSGNGTASRSKAAISLTREEILEKRLSAFETTENRRREPCVFRGLLKWNKQNYTVSIDISKGVSGVKSMIKELTKVPLNRQKIMSKDMWTGFLSDEADLSLVNFHDDFVINLTGSAGI
jgi:hypothetical protein